MNRSSLILIFIFLASLSLPAQNPRKAAKSMDLFNYTKAIQILQKSVKKAKYQATAIPMLAECYRLQRDASNARDWYAKAVILPDAKPEWYWYYAQALLTTGEYAAAQQAYMNYQLKQPGDKRIKAMALSCDSVLGPWKDLEPAYSVRLVPGLNSPQSDFGPAFLDGALVFSSDRFRNLLDESTYGWTGRAFLDLMSAKPSKPGDYDSGLEKPRSLSGKFNQTYHDGPATFTPDGNIAYFTRAFHDKTLRKDRIKTYMLKVFVTKRVDGSWTGLEPFFLNSPDYSVGHPSITADGNTIYFTSDMPGGEGGTDIWMCRKDGEGWGKPVNLGNKVNTPGDEMFPFIREDGTLFFASDGLAGYGGLDIFMTTHNSYWSLPVNLKAPINSSYDDFSLSFVPGASKGFFASNRIGGAGSDDIYAFTCIEKPKPEVILPVYAEGYVKDKKTLQPLAGATVFVLNPNTLAVTVLKTDASGKYKMEIPETAGYAFKAMMVGYTVDCMNWHLEKPKEGGTFKAPRDLLLDKLELTRNIKIENIFYDFDKWNIRPDAEPPLNEVVQVMKDYDITIELGSHTDCRGSFKYNERLAQRRAESAVNYIVSKGIDKSRITAKGYGEYQLFNKCADGVPCTEDEHQANRRTEFKVITITEKPLKPGAFNPDDFKAGQTLDAKSLPTDFYSNCR